MARLVAAELADQAVAEQVQVADRVEDLVLHELVFVAQAVLVQDPVIVEHDRVVEVAAERQVLRAHVFQVAHETEGAGAADFAQERRRREVHRGDLRAALEHRMVELDFKINFEAVVRVEARPLVAVLDLDALLDAHEALGRVLFLDAGRLQQEHEGTRAAVHDRHFACAQFDDEVVDAEARQRRHQVLDRRDRAAFDGQAGAERGLADVSGLGRDVDRLVEVGAAENDARIRRRRAQHHQHFLAGVQAHAGGANRILEGALLQHERHSGLELSRAFLATERLDVALSQCDSMNV